MLSKVCHTGKTRFFSKSKLSIFFRMNKYFFCRPLIFFINNVTLQSKHIIIIWKQYNTTTCNR